MILYQWLVKWCIAGCFLGCFVPAQGRQHYQFDNFTEMRGLSDNRVTCFLKDRTGFMWIGTEHGLNRFDGHSFRIYNPGLPGRSVSNPFINDIEQDAQGRLWVATQSGLNVIDTRLDSTLVMTPDDDAYKQKDKTIPSDLIWDIHIDPQNRVWLAADMRDLCYYDIAAQRFFHFPWKRYIAEHFPQRAQAYNSIRKIYFKSPNELWLGTAAGLFSFTISDGSFHHFSSDEADHFLQLQTSADGRDVWFAQHPGNGVQHLSMASGIKKYIPWSHIPAAAAMGNGVHAAPMVWLPGGRDLIEVNTVSRTLRKISHHADDPYSLPDGIVRTIYREPGGLVWVGTSNGVGKFNPGFDFFHFTSLFTAMKDEVPTDNDLFRTDHGIHTVFYSKVDGKYYISSPKSHALIILDGHSGEKTVLQSINGIPLTRCSVIHEDSRGMLLILAGGHLFQYNRQLRQFRVLPFHTKRGLFFTDMAEDSNGHLWIACLNDGLYRYDPISGTAIKMSIRDGFRSTLPTSLFFDRARQQLWIGTFEYGIYCYDLNRKVFHYFLQDIKRPGYIHSSLINDITGDSLGTIWIATYAGGIVRYTPAAGDSGFKHIMTADGLPENNVYSLALDRKGQLWATTYKGLSCIGADGSLKNYDRHNGLVFTNLYSPLSVSGNGELYTGTRNGFIEFNPDSTTVRSPSFPVVITSFITGSGAQAIPDTPGSLLVLPAHDREAQFNFAALSYLLPGQTRYEYQLEGVDHQWVSTGNQNSVKYNNLRAAYYRFRIRAFDFTGQRSSNEASVSFRILPPWWQLWWFRLGVLALVAGSVLFLYKRRIAVIKNKAAIRQQMAELKEKALRAQMNPHFIFNSLNAIQELIVTEKYTASYEYLSKFSRLLRMVLHLSEQNFVPLHNELTMNRLYIELESLRFQHSFRYCIQVEDSIDEEAVLFPTLLLQPFIENAIWHGLMHKEGEKVLSLHFREVNGTLVCSITDNGIGRAKAAQIRAGKLGAGHFVSRATGLAQQRMESLKLAGFNRAEILITDLVDEQGAAAGTKVEIFISSPEIPVV